MTTSGRLWIRCWHALWATCTDPQQLCIVAFRHHYSDCTFALCGWTQVAMTYPIQFFAAVEIFEKYCRLSEDTCPHEESENGPDGSREAGRPAKGTTDPTARLLVPVPQRAQRPVVSRIGKALRQCTLRIGLVGTTLLLAYVIPKLGLGSWALLILGWMCFVPNTVLTVPMYVLRCVQELPSLGLCSEEWSNWFCRRSCNCTSISMNPHRRRELTHT